MKLHLRKTRFSFGVTSAIITTMGLIAGMDDWNHAKASRIGGIVIIALLVILASDFVGQWVSKRF